MIPENLLRFNCEIIVSECRNFNRTRKNLQSGNLEILKDNLSIYIYSLKECQFWFDKMPVPNDVAVGGEGPVVYENYTMQFDYKYSNNYKVFLHLACIDIILKIFGIPLMKETRMGFTLITGTIIVSLLGLELIARSSMFFRTNVGASAWI